MNKNHAAFDILGVPKPEAKKDPVVSRKHKIPVFNPRARKRRKKRPRFGILIPGKDDVSEVERSYQEKRVIHTVERWEMKKFYPDAKNPKLSLHHWAPDEKSDLVSKYSVLNRPVEVITYSEEEYEYIQTFLKTSDWDKSQTDELFEKCKIFDLRFVVIQDKLSFQKSLESIKKRYFSIAQLLLFLRAGGNLDKVLTHPILQQPYDYVAESSRKNDVKRFYNRPLEYDKREYSATHELRSVRSSHRTINKKVRNIQRRITSLRNDERLELRKIIMEKIKKKKEEEMKRKEEEMKKQQALNPVKIAPKPPEKPIPTTQQQPQQQKIVKINSGMTPQGVKLEVRIIPKPMPMIPNAIQPQPQQIVQQPRPQPQPTQQKQQVKLPANPTPTPTPIMDAQVYKALAQQNLALQQRLAQYQKHLHLLTPEQKTLMQQYMRKFQQQQKVLEQHRAGMIIRHQEQQRQLAKAKTNSMVQNTGKSLVGQKNSAQTQQVQQTKPVQSGQQTQNVANPPQQQQQQQQLSMQPRGTKNTPIVISDSKVVQKQVQPQQQPPTLPTKPEVIVVGETNQTPQVVLPGDVESKPPLTREEIYVNNLIEHDVSLSEVRARRAMQGDLDILRKLQSKFGSGIYARSSSFTEIDNEHGEKATGFVMSNNLNWRHFNMYSSRIQRDYSELLKRVKVLLELREKNKSNVNKNQEETKIDMFFGGNNVVP